MNKAILFCILSLTAFFLLGTLTGCAKVEKVSSYDKIEQRKLALQNDMLAFFRDHREEMERFALRLRDLERNRPDYHYQYGVKENALYVFDDVHIQAQEKIVARPVLNTILSDTSFFKETQAFESVSWLTMYFDCDICAFDGNVVYGGTVGNVVYDGTDSIYATLFLFYCEDEPVTGEYDYVEQLADNWYFYVEYRE